jgi:hypothetical protein
MSWWWAAIALLALGLGATLGLTRVPRTARAAPPAAPPAAPLGSETVAAPPPSQAAGLDALLPATQPRAHVPAGFDVAAFLRAAKEIFIGAREERRDVVTLNAHLLEVATEDGRHAASVRFSGLAREAPGAEAASFEEVWNLVKPADGSGGWLLAGIQQMH